MPDSAVGRALETGDPLVIALGGGTYAQPGRAERLRAAGIPVIWLDSPVELLLARCATMSNRPPVSRRGQLPQLAGGTASLLRPSRFSRSRRCRTAARRRARPGTASI